MKQTSTKLTALVLALSLLLTACGGGATAATMHLRKTQGTVGVSDGEGKNVEPRDDLGLYSGYGVDTQAESYAWIDLDEVKLTKLDANSEVEIVKEDKHLKIDVKSGSLFFNVIEPLGDDETMDIVTSTMAVGIRGTCGWVTEDTAALLEGTVEVTAGEQTATISAGEMAVLTPEGTLEVTDFTPNDVPAFVKAELEDDSALAEEIEVASGIDVLAPVPDVMYVRDMYTYSRAQGYNINGEPTNESECFPDEQGRIGRTVSHISPPSGREFTSEAKYVYNDEGALQTIEHANGVVYTITENTADHRKMVRGDMAMEYIEYYDELGREIRQEHFMDGKLDNSTTFTYDSEGKLIRSDTYGPDGTSRGYALYEYD